MRSTIRDEYRRYEQRQLAELLAGSSGQARRFAGLIATLRLWQSRRQLRRQMARDMRTFNDAMFEDAGTTRKQAEREVRKPFWHPIGD